MTDIASRKLDQVLPLPRSLNETTNKQSLSLAIRRINQGLKSVPSSENIQPRTGHNPRNSRPTTRVQATDAPNISSTVHQPLPFKLVPVLPPSKNKIITTKSGAPSGTNRQAAVSIVPIQLTINVSSNSNPVLPTVDTPAQDKAMMLEDAAIVSIIIGDEGMIADKNERANGSVIALGTRDESSDLSLGEKVQATVDLEESINKNLPNAFDKAGLTHVETTPASIIVPSPAKSNNIEVESNSQLLVDNCPSAMTNNKQDTTPLRLEQSIEKSEGTSTSINSVEVSGPGEIGNQPDEPNPYNVIFEGEPRHLGNQLKIKSTQEYLQASKNINQLETSAPITRDNHLVATRGKDGPTGRDLQPSVLVNESNPASVLAESCVIPTESNEQHQSSPNRTTTGAEFDRSLQQPMAHSIHDQPVDDFGVKTQSFKPDISSVMINVEQSLERFRWR